MFATLIRSNTKYKNYFFATNFQNFRNFLFHSQFFFQHQQAMFARILKTCPKSDQIFDATKVNIILNIYPKSRIFVKVAAFTFNRKQQQSCFGLAKVQFSNSRTQRQCSVTRCGKFSPFGRILEALGEFLLQNSPQKISKFLGEFLA